MSEYYPEYEVVMSEEVTVGKYKFLCSVDIGSTAVEKLYQLAENGIPEAKKIEFSWGLNVDIYFDKDGLTSFIKREYPNDYDYCVSDLEVGKIYLLCAVDMS